MTSKPAKLYQVGNNITKGKEVESQQKMMMEAEAKRRLVASSKKK